MSSPELRKAEMDGMPHHELARTTEAEMDGVPHHELARTTEGRDGWNATS